MRPNYETFLKHRRAMLDDLQKYSRRANGIAPIANYEDLGIVRNTIPASFDFNKFGSLGSEFFLSSPVVQIYLTKQAAFTWDDVVSAGESAWEGLKGAVSSVGSAAKNLVLLPVNTVQGAIEGWSEAEGPWYNKLLGSISGASEGVLRPFTDVGRGAYRLGRGVVGGAGRLAQVDEWAPGLTGTLKRWDPAMEEIASAALPVAASFLIPGGQAAGASAALRAAGLASKVYNTAAIGSLAGMLQSGERRDTPYDTIRAAADRVRGAEAQPPEDLGSLVARETAKLEDQIAQREQAHLPRGSLLPMQTTVERA